MTNKYLNIKNYYGYLKNLYVLSISLFLSFSANLSLADQNFALRAEVQLFMQEMHLKHKLELQQLAKMFSNYSTNQLVLERISNPAEKLTWNKYRELLLSPARIAKGKIFLHKHYASLVKAEQQFGVPKEIITAILGVESFYGERAGNIPVMQALATLTFDYPPRAKFFRQELEQFLLLVKEEKLDPTQIKGSYAGAMSPAQFIASSYRAYAVDFANIGNKNLDNIVNAIGSIANYFKQHGWQKQEFIAVKADLRKSKKHRSANLERVTKYLEPSTGTPKLKYLVKELMAAGISINNLPKQAINNKFLAKPAALLEFTKETTKSPNNANKGYWLGFNNFVVITKYNHSVNYAMAVYQLALSLGLKEYCL